MDSVDIIGAGFVPNVPGLYGNCRIYYDARGVHHIGPLYQEWSEHPEQAPPPEPTPEPAPQPEPEPVPPQDVPPPLPVSQVNGG